jgi:iron complex outermembrane receptor protein
MKLISRFCWAVSFGAMELVCGGAAAFAQTADTADSRTSVLEEIVVTAQKRTESLQDIPISISVLTGEHLQQTGAEGFQDYLPGVAGVSYLQIGGQENAIFIRGVSGGLNEAGASTTGIYIDEAPVSQNIGGTVNLSPFDLQRIEILRGPQGTLYGASSMGGTIRLIMNKPDLQNVDVAFDGTGSYTHGANYEANGMVNVPLLSNTLGLRITSGYRDLSGYIDDPGLGKSRINYDKLTTARVQLRWQPAEQADVLLSVAYQKEVYGENSLAFVGPKYGAYQANYVYPVNGEQPFYLYGLTVKYDLGFANITSATNYAEKEATHANDSTSNAVIFGVKAQPGQYIAAFSTYDSKIFTEELRLASKDSGPFDWLLGAYYEAGTPPNLSAQWTTNIPALQGTDLYSSHDDGNQHQRAVFGELGYHILPSLEVKAGLRESHYETHTPTLQSGILAGGPSLYSYSSARSQFTDKRFAINYQVAPEHLLYTQAASGSRPGVDSGASGLPEACLAELPALGYATPPKIAQPDNLWTYEVGSKNSLADRRLTLDGDVYYTRWRNVQNLILLSCGYDLNGNAGAAQIRGAELEINARPIDPLLLTLSAALTDTEISGGGNVGLGALEGDPLPMVPKYNGSFSSRYDFPLFGGAKGYFRTDVTYVDAELAGFAARRSGFRMSPYTLPGARLGFLKDNYELSLFATNLANHRIVTWVQQAPYADAVARPRTIGLNVKFRL